MSPQAPVLLLHTLIPHLGRYPMSHAPFVTPMIGDRILISWFAGSREWDRDVRLLAAVHSPAKRNWERIFELVSDPGFSLGNQVLATDARGDLHLFYVRTQGHWQDGEIVHLVFEDGDLSVARREQIVPLPRGWLVRGRPLLSGVTLLLPVYCERSATSAVWRHDLGCEGGKLSELVSATGGLIQPILVEVAAGELRGFFRNARSPCRVHFAYSMDHGRKWSLASPTELPNPNSAIDVGRMPDGRLLCAYNDSDSLRTPLSLALSADNGKSWRKIMDLESGLGEFSYPSLLIATESIHIAYSLDRRAIRFLTLAVEELLSGV